MNDVSKFFKKTKSRSHSGHENKTPKQWEIWWADSLSFGDGVHSKGRPVLILSRDGKNFRCFKCTSQASEFRIRPQIHDTISAGLDKETYIDCENILIPQSKLIRYIGQLSEDDIAEFKGN